MVSRWLIRLLIAALLAVPVVGAQNTPPPSKPISQQGLMEALRIGGLSEAELVQIVTQRGVAFALTRQVETDLRAAGAQAALLEAVRVNYRPPAAAPRAAQTGPLSPSEIVTLLQVQTPLPRIQQLVSERRVSFALTPAVADELTAAGADQGLLAAIQAAAPGDPSGTAPPALATAGAPLPSSVPGLASPAGTPTRLRSVAEVHKLYIDKMKNNLDQYLRAELTKQLPDRFVLVLNKEDADGLLLGVGEQQTDAKTVITGHYLGLNDTATGAVSLVDKAGTVLWASEAGDRTLLFGPLKRGGAREVAKRLVQDLKKALQAEQ